MQVNAKDGRSVWAPVCAHHAKVQGLTSLGTGRAQYLLHPDELDNPRIKGLAEALEIPLARVLDTRGDEPQWSTAYRAFGFVRAARGRLVRRGLKTTVWAELADSVSGAVGIKVRKVNSFTFDDRGWDAVHPVSWPQGLIREVLFRTLDIEPDLPRVRSLTIGVPEAESIVRAGLDRAEQRFTIGDYLTGEDRDRFGQLGMRAWPSPYGRATAVAAAGSADYGLLRRILEDHPDARHRTTILRREDCPESLLLAGVDDPVGRYALLTRKAGLPSVVVDPLFTRIALSSAAQEGRGTMLEAALHPSVPLQLLEGILEKALVERDCRTTLIRASDSLDDERRDTIRAAVLRRTYRGKVLDAVMAGLLGHHGVMNERAIEWLNSLPERQVRDRALRWIGEHATDLDSDVREMSR